MFRSLVRPRRLRLLALAVAVTLIAQPTGLAARRDGAVPGLADATAVAAAAAPATSLVATVPRSSGPTLAARAGDLPLERLDAAVVEADLAVARHQAALDDAAQARQTAEVDLARMRDRLRAAEDAVATLRAQLAAHAVSLYVSPNDDVVMNLAGSADLATTTRRRGLASTVAAAGPTALERLRAEQKELLRLSAAVELALTRSAAQAGVEDGARARLEEAAVVRVELADTLARRIAELHRHIDGLEAGEAEILRIISGAQLAAEAAAAAEARRDAERRLDRPAAGDLTSPFGWRWGRLHAGVDFDGDIGDDVWAARSGFVLSTEYNTGGYGQVVILDHGDGMTTLYAHLSEVFVGPGERVRRGQRIAAIGATGNVTGSHLHFETRENGVPVDPRRYLD